MTRSFVRPRSNSNASRPKTFVKGSAGISVPLMYLIATSCDVRCSCFRNAIFMLLSDISLSTVRLSYSANKPDV